MVPEPAPGGIDIDGVISIGLFPGSRPNVFKRHIDVLLRTADIIGNEVKADIKIFCVPGLAEKCKGLPYPCIVENDYKERRKLAFAITPSGTVSTENALLAIPMVVYYKLSNFNYLIAKMLANVRYITMVNILLDRMLIPELIQKDATAEKISDAALGILKEKAVFSSIRKELLGIRSRLGEPGVSDRAAGIILS
jgi:lipid-A-disaccharide synthase